MTEVFRQIGAQIERDLRVAEAITLPVLLVLLIWIFGGVVAAALPLAVGVFSMAGTFLPVPWVPGIAANAASTTRCEV